MFRKLRNPKGFTLLEVMVATVLGLIVIGATYMVYLSQHKGFLQVDRQSDKVQSARIALDQITRMLRQAGFSVAIGQALTDAKTYELTFRGDVDNDIDTYLAVAASAGDSEIKVDLDDEEAMVNTTDAITIRYGTDEEEIQVRTVGGPAFDLSGEPDTIYLASALTNSYPASDTSVRTVETIAVQHDYNEKKILINGQEIAKNVTDLQFKYFNESDTELVPEEAQSLNLTNRANVRRVEVTVTVASPASNSTRTEKMGVELRNMDRISSRTDVTAPAAPTGLTIIERGTCGQFTIRFSGPTQDSDGGDLIDLAGYKVYYGNASGAYWQPAYPVSDEALTEVTVQDSRLESGQAYYVAMTAYDGSFNESAKSGEIVFNLEDETPPEPPTNIVASSSETGITLTWEAPENVKDIKGWRIYRSTNAGSSALTPIVNEEVLKHDALAYVDTDVETCRTYYYQIRAIDCVNEGELTDDIFGDGDGPKEDEPSRNITNTTVPENPPVPPDYPTSVAANGSDSSITLQWINPENPDLAGVVIRWAANYFPSSVNDGIDLGNYPGNPGQSMNAVHTGLTNGQTYYYSLFTVDHCGNYGYPYHITGMAGTYGPVVEITSPISGTTISNGQLIIQARAYDPDEATLSADPSVDTDNGKGIASMTFTMDPTPNYGDFPRSEYNVEYCGFSGNTNPCPAGDVSNWCDGTYHISAVAVDNEGDSTTAPYSEVKIKNGGVYTDDSFARSLDGTYKNRVTFQITNTAANKVTITHLIPKWDRNYARLNAVEAPTGNVIWSKPSGYPAFSGDELYFGSGTDDSIALDGGGTITLTLEFVYFYETLTSGFSSGATRFYVNNAWSFTPGNTVYFSNGSDTGTNIVSSTGDGYVDLRNEMSKAFPSGTTVTEVEDYSYCPMGSANLTVQFGYTLDWLSQECQTDDFEITVESGPVIYDAFQDEPSANTAVSETTGSVTVANFRPVPVHIKVTDNNNVGIQKAQVHYKIDSSSSSVAPTTGYALIDLTYSSSDGWYEGSVPYSSNTRIWFYFSAVDNMGQSTRLPESGAFSYDYVSESQAPACPLGLTLTAVDRRRVDLSWIENSEADLRGYNIYRMTDCKAYNRVYTLITDIDSSTVGVQYIDNDTHLNTNGKCYNYYITGEDLQGNESTGCEAYAQSVGYNCPCN